MYTLIVTRYRNLFTGLTAFCVIYFVRLCLHHVVLKIGHITSIILVVFHQKYNNIFFSKFNSYFDCWYFLIVQSYSLDGSPSRCVVKILCQNPSHIKASCNFYYQNMFFTIIIPSWVLDLVFITNICLFNLCVFCVCLAEAWNWEKNKLKKRSVEKTNIYSPRLLSKDSGKLWARAAKCKARFRKSTKQNF